MYAVVADTPPMLPSHPGSGCSGWQPGRVLVLAWVESSALTSLWCAWAAVTRVAIAAYLRHEHRPTEMQVKLA